MQLKLSSLVTLAVSLAIISGAFAVPIEGADKKGLDALFKKNGKLYFGAAIRSGELTKDELAIAEHELGSVTPEHLLKWDATEATPGAFSFDGADKVVAWATEGGKLIHGQTLVWQSQVPAWVSRITDKDVLTEAIERHVTTVVGRYAGKIYSWEVVKEVLNENGSLRNTVFSKTFEGPGFIPVAFKAARKADPKAKLYIDDYNLDKSPEKVAGLVDLVSQLNTEYPDLIDGISSQAHLGDLTLYPDNAVESALTALSRATGIKEVAISELDIPGAKPEDYASVIEACLKVEKCIGVTVWGISDTYSWRAATTPLLWDAEYKKKPAYYAISKALVKPE